MNHYGTRSIVVQLAVGTHYMEKRGPDSDAETLSGFAEYVRQHSKTREDIKTWFDALAFDDYVSFGGKACPP